MINYSALQTDVVFRYLTVCSLVFVRLRSWCHAEYENTVLLSGKCYNLIALLEQVCAMEDEPIASEFDVAGGWVVFLTAVLFNFEQLLNHVVSHLNM